MIKRRIIAAIAAAALIFALLTAGGCTTVMDEYESDTFELGSAASSSPFEG